MILWLLMVQIEAGSWWLWFLVVVVLVVVVEVVVLVVVGGGISFKLAGERQRTT
uniref:HDC18302 n=1 Tax=Drosophila melanogaster TaxID=7227 RepID=Q6IIH1_DROME|nr:TPA_inf: HDC18302 [Drosophila melanogaster]